MLCVLILYISGGTYSLKSTPNDSFWETFHGNFIYYKSFCQKSAERNRRKNTSRIWFWCLTWGSNPGSSSNKPTHYLLDHGDFRWWIWRSKKFDIQATYNLIIWSFMTTKPHNRTKICCSTFRINKFLEWFRITIEFVFYFI